MARKNPLCHLLGLILIFGLPPIVHGTEWRMTAKPYKIGPVKDICIGYDGLTKYIFAAGDSGSNKLWVTTDEGQNWQVSHNVSGYWHTRVVIEETSADAGWTLVQGTSNTLAGPYRAIGELDNWVRKAAGISTPNKLYALAASQISADLVKAFVGGEGNSGNSHRRISIWDDNGGDWDPKQNGLPEDEDGTVWDIAFYDDGLSEYLYCAYEGNEDGPGLYRSINGGQSWTGVDIPIGGGEYLESAMAVEVDTYLKNRVFVVEKSPQIGRIWMNEELGTEDWMELTDEESYSPSGYMQCNSASYGHNAYDNCCQVNFGFNKPDNNGVFWVSAGWGHP